MINFNPISRIRCELGKFFLFLALLVGISIEGLAMPSNFEIQKLALTCKVWGFLKYYHPAVASGKLNWDLGLVKILPIVAEEKSLHRLNKIGLTVISSIGDVPKCTTCAEINRNWFNKNFSLSWTDNTTRFSQPMIERLDHIEQNRFQPTEKFRNGSYYATKGELGQAVFSNELVGEYFGVCDDEFRLLDLFRYWNAIEYFFPYKYQMDLNWDSTLIEMIPEFLKSRSIREYQLTLNNLIARINDSHSTLTSSAEIQFRGDKMIPVIFKLIDDTLVVIELVNENLLQNKNLQMGDVVSQINDQPVSKILDEWEYAIPASNLSASRRDIAILFSFTFQDSVKFTLRRRGKQMVSHVRSYPLDTVFAEAQDISSQEKWIILNKNIGYANLRSITDDEVKQMMHDLSSCRSIVFDLRNYPPTTIHNLGQYFVSDPWNFANFIVPDYGYPGRFIWRNEEWMRMAQKIRALQEAYTGPSYSGEVFVLVSDWTQSDAEGMAMCFQTFSNCTVVGNHTAGAVGFPTSISFYSTHQTTFSGVGVFYPDSTEIQRTGVSIDYYVPVTIEGLSSGEDEVLNFALSLAEK